MIKSWVKWVLVVALAGGAGLGIGFGYGQLQLKNQEEAHQAKVKEFNRALYQAQRKYAEERALQATLEDEKQALRAEVEELKKEKERLVLESNALKSKAASLEEKATSLTAQVASLGEKARSLEARAASLEKRADELSARLSKTEAERASLEKKYLETARRLAEREKDLGRANAEGRRLEGDLKNMSRKYEQCAAKNVRIYTIAEEVIGKYKDKGVMDSILAKEPLTQVQRVELEKLVQEYRDKIEEQKIREK